jgi:tetratricopeptide (TPR) repeat protein
VPTIARKPAQWNLSLRLAWFPAAAAAAVLGAMGLLAAWSWSIEAEHSGVVADRLTAAGAKAVALPPWVKPPDPRWWKTTPGHLTLWALWLDRAADDPATVEEAQQLLAAAARAAPLQARVRFAQARREPGSAEGPAAGSISSLALSRDVLPLAWTGHQLLAAGKKDAAQKAYRKALELASRAELSRLAPPGFIDDSQVRRYAMPAEDLIKPIVRDMADSSAWTYAEWSAAVPPDAVARLVAVRVLRERSVTDFEAALDALVAEGDTAPSPGARAALAIAAHAEALALKQRWGEADQRYRQALEQMPDPTIRRSWWVNLAEIALRQNDESGRQKALEAARGNDPNEEITRRAVELLKDYGVRTERGSSRSSP